MASETTWIVVADGQSARFFLRARPGLRLTELTELALTATEERRMHGRPTAVHDAVNYGHLVQPAHRNRQDTGEDHFLRHVAGRINLAVGEHSVGRLAICAPPHALGVLRNLLSDAARHLIVEELSKDIVHEALAEIDERFSALKV